MRIILERKNIGRCLTILNVLKSHSSCGREHNEAKFFELESRGLCLNDSRNWEVL